MRGWKKSNPDTVAMNYDDPRSFVTLPDSTGTQHEILYGKDINAQREKLAKRAHGRCELEFFTVCKGWTDLKHGEVHHKQPGLVGRCDCLDATLFVCKPCHRYVHRSRNPKWSKK